MENNISPVFVLLYIFLGGSGVYAIILSLYKLTNPHKVIDPNATLQIKLFKLNGPVGFIYGISVIVLVIYLARTENAYKMQIQLAKYKTENEALDKENRYLKSIIGDSAYSKPSIFRISVTSNEPVSLFDGQVLVDYEFNVFSSSKISIRGISGLSESENGNFNKSELPIKKGQKIFIKLISNTKYGINILEDIGSKSLLEFYRINNEE